MGSGGFDPAAVERAENFIDDNRYDFTPYAQQCLDRLQKAINVAKKAQMADKPVINTITGPIMELKATGGMFSYELVTEIAGIILNFLENIDELNDDSFNILAVHQQAVEVIIGNKLTGPGGREGRALAQELHDACQRYKKKYSLVLDIAD